MLRRSDGDPAGKLAIIVGSDSDPGPMRASLHKHPEAPPHDSTLLDWRAAAALALALALLDLAFGLLPSPPSMVRRLAWAATSLATVQVGVLAALGIALGKFAIDKLVPSRRWFRASAAWAGFCLGGFAGFLTARTYSPGGDMFAGTGLGVLSAGAAFWAADRLTPRQARALLHVAPWLAAVMVLMQILKRAGLLAGWAAPLAAWVAACVVLFAGLLFWSWLRPASTLLARAPLVAAALIAALGASAPFRGAVYESPERPLVGAVPAYGPIVLLTIDTLRRDAVSFEADGPTPRLAELAADSIVFERAYSAAPWTKPALASMMTGLSPGVHRLRAFNDGLSPKASTLAEMLAAVGYRTEAVGSNPLLSAFESEGSLARGFERYEVYPLQGVTIPNLVGRSLARALLFNLMGFDANSEQLTAAAASRLRENASKAFFLWLHYYDPHEPYSPPPERLPKGARLRSFSIAKVDPAAFDQERQEAVKALYEAETGWVDEQVGEIVEELKSLGLYDNALVIVSSDHGEELWDHGRLNHGHSLYDELLGATLIVKLPGSPRRARIDRAVSTLRVTPTILDLAGVDYQPEAFTQRSLRPLLEGSGEPDVQPPFATAAFRGPHRGAVIVDGFKLICGEDCADGEAYDLNADPGETINLWNRQTETQALALALLAAHRADSARLRERLGIGGPRSFQLQPEEIERLKSLGYIQ